MPGRTFSSTNYRYGFNGKENDQEANSTGEGTQDYGMRIYNPQLGRFLSVDPITAKYPELTPYQFASNTPIRAIDRDGEEGEEKNGGQETYRALGYNNGFLPGGGVEGLRVVSGNTIVIGRTNFYLDIGSGEIFEQLGWSVRYQQAQTASMFLRQPPAGGGGANTPGQLTPTVPPASQTVLNNTTPQTTNTPTTVDAPRPTWQQSEAHVQEMMGEGYSPQVSYLNREVVPYGTKGSVRPELMNESTLHSVEVKNYDVTTTAGRSRLAKNVSGQANYRYNNLPEGTQQSVYLDVRGQNLSAADMMDVRTRITNKLENNVTLDINFIEH